MTMTSGSDEGVLAGSVYDKRADSPRRICVAHYENDTDCCQCVDSQSQARAAQSNVWQARPGIEPGPAWQGGGVSWPKGQLNITGCRM